MKTQKKNISCTWYDWNYFEEKSKKSIKQSIVLDFTKYMYVYDDPKKFTKPIREKNKCNRNDTKDLTFIRNE